MRFIFGEGRCVFENLANSFDSAVFENTEEGRFEVNYALSHDDGYSWDQTRRRLYTAGNGKICGAPQGKPDISDF